jgi:hypothetical protein
MQANSTKPLKSFFIYPFKEHSSAKKILIGTVLTFANYLIPFIPGIFVTGYVAKIARRIILDDGELHLPDWNDWGNLFKDGLKISVIGFLFSIPALLVFFFGFAAYFGSFIGLMIESSRGIESAEMLILYTICLFIWIFSLFIGLFLIFVAGLILPPAIMHTVSESSIGSAFHIRQWWLIFRKNLSGFLISFVIVFGLSHLVLYAIYGLYYTIILCFIIPFVSSFAVFYLLLVAFPLFAQAYKEGLPLNENTENKIPTNE